MITFSNKFVNILAVFLLLCMLAVAFLSMKNDSLTMDEQAHIPAGYGYMHEQDYRLNPEHPPLLKDLAAIPLLFMRLNFDKEFSAWENDVNGQWATGLKFIFNSGNNPDKIIFWARIPMLLILMLFGFYIFKWTKELFGPRSALFALFLFSFSPTFIAHGRLVTTDVSAAAAFFIATYYFIKWTKNPSKKNLIIAGIVFGIAQLIKFSLFLLVPTFGLFLIIWIIIAKKRFWSYIGKFILILAIGYLVIYPVYQYHVLNYPPQKQVSDAKSILASYSIRPLANLIIFTADKPILRAYSQYLLGLLMVFQRASGGNTTFFMGEINNQAWVTYFPTVYAIKEPLALHILTIIAMLFLVWSSSTLASNFRQSLKNNFPEWMMLLFIIIYWLFSIKSNLNIGVRHILPTFPFVYVLISGQLKRFSDYIKNKKIFSKICYALFAFCLIWYAISSFSVFPYYLTYFNELVGGAKNGYIYVTDSNLDWGQDLKRLANWVDENNISKIKLDYFGGDDPQYRLGDKFEPWHGDYNPEEAKNSYLAVSATFLQGGRGFPVPGFNYKSGEYRWLYNHQPVAVIGNSIFVYYIK